MNRLLTHLYLAIILVMVVSTNVLAQRRRVPEMDSMCNRWYSLAMQDVESERCLLYADSIYNRGKRLGQDKALFRAAQIRVLHYSHFNNYTTLHNAAEEVRRLALQQGEMRMYYHATELEVRNRLNFGHTLEALKCAREMLDQVGANESHYAKYLALVNLGNVYYQRKDYRHVVTSIDSALMFETGARNERKGLKTAEAYVTLAAAQLRLKKWDSAQLNYERAIERSADWSDSVFSIMGYAQMWAYRDVEKDFRKMYAKVEDVVKRRPLDSWQLDSYLLLKAYKAMYDKDMEAAHMLAACVVDDEKRTRLERDIYIKNNEPFKALEMEYKLITQMDSVYFRLTTQDVVLLNQQLNNNVLRDQAEQQERLLNDMQMAQLAQRQLQAEERIRLGEQQTAMMLKIAKEDSLNAAAAQSRSQINMLNADQRIMSLRDEARKLYQSNTIMCMSIYVLLLLGMSFLFVFSRVRSTANNLEVLSAQLEKAHSEASNMNKIKTAFIQNMNYEVRSPLNEVTGFAQVLSSKDIALTEEERLEYGQHITDSAMALNALIDNILTIADIESGKREVQWKQHQASTIMQMAKSAAMSSLPTGVTLNCATDNGKDITLVTDQRRVQQALVCLVKNATKHMQQGTITIDCTKTSNGNVVFSVADTCGTLSDKMKEDIAQSLQDRQEAGIAPMMDLGLCKLMMNMLNGHVEHDTTYKHGMKINLIMPNDDNERMANNK